jgi:hypothetical protein
MTRRAARLISQIITRILNKLTEAVARLGPSPVARDRNRPGGTTMFSLHLLDLLLDGENLPLGPVCLAVWVLG